MASDTKGLVHLGDFDVIVVGAGHAGIEAAAAAARLGVSAALFTLGLDGIGNMPCNPSIGGTAKGHLVREIDALGGVMALAADATTLQSRMLNRGKGPAVHSLRAQIDRQAYHRFTKEYLEHLPGLSIKQAEVVDILIENGRVKGVCTRLHGFYGAKAVVLCTGTNLAGKIFVGDASVPSGPDGQHAATLLAESLRAAGLPMRRFKTGTPARVHRRSTASSPGPTPKLTTSSGLTSTARLSTAGPSRESAPATAPASRTRWCALPTRSATRFSWSPAARTPKKCTSRA